MYEENEEKMKHFGVEKVGHLWATHEAELTSLQTAKLPELVVVLEAYIDSGGHSAVV